MAKSLVDYFNESAARRPQHVAAEESTGESISYAELAVLSDSIRDRLRQLGIRHGDRVGIHLPKSIDALAAILGTMKAGAAYVPVDSGAPAWRSAYIMNDCDVGVVLLEASQLAGWSSEASKLGTVPVLWPLESVAGGKGIRRSLETLTVAEANSAGETERLSEDDLAYLLYTSGSTGRPKGVMLSHGAALGFVEWCSRTFDVSEADRFSSHAPFHFDLSILDLYLPMKLGATVVLIGSSQGKEPAGLALLIAERAISVWYSTPTVLTLLAQYGKLERHDLQSLRIVFFAGEVFPVKHLRQVKALLPRPSFFNLYGPTETNVCTWHPIPDVIPIERTTPFPIGTVCDHLRSRVVSGEGRDVPPGEEGELLISGANLLSGYWNLPEQTAQTVRRDERGGPWYATGDIVTDDGTGCLLFAGRRDRMVKRRGYRIELDEVEANLYRHPAVTEAAVISENDADGGVRLKAFMAFAESATPTVIELKRYCAEHIPSQMIPDQFEFRQALPRTSTDKVDYQRLTAES